MVNILRITKRYFNKITYLLLLGIVVTYHYTPPLTAEPSENKRDTVHPNPREIRHLHQEHEGFEVQIQEDEKDVDIFSSTKDDAEDEGPQSPTPKTQSREAASEPRRPAANVLLLSSIGRSGSSFLGGLLNSHPGAFYIFEPLHLLEAWHRLTEATARESFKQIFTCNIRSALLKPLMKESRFTIRNSYRSLCKSNGTCYDPVEMNRVCSQHSMRIVKTIRTRVAWLVPLLKDPDIDLKILHLVRDPRASVISAAKQWDVRPERKCANLEEDLQSGRLLNDLFPGRYMAIRYEDLCEDPDGMAKIIFSFLGYRDIPPSTLRFLRISTSTDIEKSFGIQRDTTKQQQKWRQEITAEQLRDIEGACASAIAAVGFNLFKDLETARNLSVPLYDVAKAGRFFPYYDGR
ncbi:carbohydrate sulfotransferase 3-like [Penaeus japonicus]|uniref:carbohydrate sulfotransferase 3-like n=1 Tax=Penaeus japonicus TaxID=27405 RepID=UPI001C714BC0|nr:carbohydrate sulfotransferase 3-like [Penaeus japonicus]